MKIITCIKLLANVSIMMYFPFIFATTARINFVVQAIDKIIRFNSIDGI